MKVSDACGLILDSTLYDYGKFFGPSKTAQPLGVGQIYKDVRYPIFNHEDHVYDTRMGIVYVLTHECDIDQENERPFNDLAIVCPIISFQDYISSLPESVDNDRLTSFLKNVAKGRVSRVIYVPPYGDELPYGGIMYLNQISHAHVSSFSFGSAEFLTSLTGYSLRIVDLTLTNHLLRPKSASLPLIEY